MSKVLYRPSPALVVALVALFVALGGTAVAAGVQPSRKADVATPSLGAWITFSEAQLVPNDPTTLRAFVATQSTSRKCLVTLSEANWPMVGTTVFCALRIMAGVPGVEVSVFFPVPPPKPMVLIATVLQEGAKSYANPVYCDPAQGC